MEVQEAERLIDEIKQIKEQYEHEVGSKGKPWPKSIRGRVLQLIELGFTMKSISDDTGIPYYSVLNWRHRKRSISKAREFKELAVTTFPTGVVTAPESRPRLPISGAVAVITPSGYRIEGSRAIDVVKVLRALNGGV